MYGMVWLKKAVNLFGLFDDYVLNFLVSEATWIFSIFFSVPVYHVVYGIVRVQLCTCMYTQREYVTYLPVHGGPY